ncbi:pimeloyl-ACP methyl ester carboxylesterase [Pedobacter cryoconitis]|uniref:Pimeloyl-ACP methyl ester carboxylesterase n=1 Tax=Pedobacter cryoconitis TaxID=188932 RepID=A0A7W8ZQH4_9SPHI|nr:alpha/beta hydrolase [Pedobacter cryoconitis]MBB5638326.1 pimeloyl-ACP methyl ester carboxylesterase [Pedobacter cryoconitis]
MKSVKMLSFILLILLGSNVSRAQNKTTNKPTIIFVHGVWADGSSFVDQITALQSKGYNVISVQNPVTSLDDDVAATKRAIEMAPGKVILVGHSWGGFVITQAGNDPKVSGLVYIAAFAPDSGENVATLSSKGPATEISKYFITSGEFIFLSKEGMQKSFAQDLSAKLQNLIYATQIPLKQSAFSDKSLAPAWKQKASWYILTKNDKALSPELQRFMSKRIKAKTIEIESGHVAMFSHSKEILNVIEEAASAR